MLPSCVHMQKGKMSAGRGGYGRASGCLRWTSQTTCGDGAAMLLWSERWSTRAVWRTVRREAAG